MSEQSIKHQKLKQIVTNTINQGRDAGTRGQLPLLPFSRRGNRAVARALIGGGGGVYSYIRVMPDEFLFKSVVFKLMSKEISRAEHEYMNIHPPPPINALATALWGNGGKGTLSVCNCKFN